MDKVEPQNVLEIVGPRYALILSIVEEAWSIWSESQNVIAQRLVQYSARNRSIGSAMSDILRALFKEREADLPAIEFIEQANLFFIVVEKSVVIRFNLMDQSGMTIHTDTEQSKKYRNSELVIEGFEPKEYLYAGYSMDSSKSQLVNFMILKREHDQTPVWILDKHNNIYQQTDITFTTPARTVTPTQRTTPAKRASAKKGLIGNEQLQTGTNNE